MVAWRLQVDASQFYYDLDALRQEDLPEHVRGPA